jgi:arylsulfatase A-like enzyme
MRRRDFLGVLTAAILGGCAGAAQNSRAAPTTRAGGTASSGTARRTNILVIVADDLGYADLGCYGGRDVPTPNIDSLAANGVRFTNGYVTAPVCSPTRAGLITGRYQQRFGHEFNPGDAPQQSFGLSLDQTTLPQILREHGYATGMVGKWHLGTRPRYGPTERGFDEYYGFLTGAHAYLNQNPTGPNPILRGTTPVEEREYLTDAFAREASAYIDRHHDEPFFLYLTFNAVHTPQQATEKYQARFAHIQDPRRRMMAAMLSAMDDGVGRVLETLGKHGIEDDTLILFISDNGGPTPSNASRNDPFSGYKGQLWEGGIRVPFIVQWKRQIPGGGVEGVPVHSLDIVPTALAAAGVPLPNNVDGQNLMSVGDRALFWRFGEPRAVRRGNSKLLMLPGQPPMLFDLSKDPGEKHDLASQNPHLVRELQAEYEQWDRQMMPPKWGRTPPPRPRQRRRDRRPAGTQPTTR